MHGFLRLRDDNENEVLNNIFIHDDDTFNITLNIDNVIFDYNKLIDEILLDIIDDLNDFFLHYGDNDKKIFLDEFKKNIRDSFNMIEYIFVEFTSIDILEFIKTNDCMKTKKIVLEVYYDMNNIEEIKKLLDIYKGYEDIIYIKLRNNSTPINIKDAYDVIKNIEFMAKYIMSLNLSPLETIMFTYDVVKNRVYKKENEDDSYTESRDLKNVLEGDKIVCVGYANYFDALLNYMNFSSKLVHLTPKQKDNGHVRNLIYVVDSKYGIDGAYYFDVTWDCKQEDETNDYLFRYLHFAKTRKEMEALEEYQYDYSNHKFYGKELGNIFNRPEYFDDIYYVEKLIFSINSINYMSKLVYGEELLKDLLFSKSYRDFIEEYDINILRSKIKDLVNKFNKPIYANTYLEVLRNVRKAQYYIEPDSCIYDINEMYKAYIESQWKFKDTVLSDTERLMLAIFGEEPKEKSKKDNFITYMNKTKLCRDIEGTKLSKVLSLYLNSKK